MLLKRLFGGLFFCLLNQVSLADNNIFDVCHTHSCRIVIDAGSSGSRLHVYAFDEDQNSNLSNIQEIFVNKIKPGLSALEIEDVPDYVQKLMKNVPEEDFKIDLYATAGMRSLPEYKQYALYATIRQWFDKHPNWNLIETRTISGTEEGMYGWLALNNILDDKNNHSVGFIEIGGSSSQVAFPVSDLTNISSDNIISFKYQGKRYTLFSHSFSGFGAGEIMKKFINNKFCFPIDYQLSNKEVANGDANLCQEQVISELNANDAISNIVKLPIKNNPVNSWYTSGAIGSISHKLPLNILSHEFSIAELLTKSDTVYCKQSWEFQKQNYAAFDEYLDQNCLISSFFYGLTTSAYGMDENQIFKTFGKEIDWTLGALLINLDSEHHH